MPVLFRESRIGQFSILFFLRCFHSNITICGIVVHEFWLYCYEVWGYGVWGICEYVWYSLVIVIFIRVRMINHWAKPLVAFDCKLTYVMYSYFYKCSPEGLFMQQCLKYVKDILYSWSLSFVLINQSFVLLVSTLTG